MRDYLGLEFQDLKENIPFEYDLESIIDDWVNFLILSLVIILVLLFRNRLLNYSL